MKFIDRVLNRFGYYKSSIPKSLKVSEADILEMFRTYGQTKSFRTLLYNLCERDKNLYFNASNDSDRERIQGAYQRTNYFISLINKSNDKRKEGGK